MDDMGPSLARANELYALIASPLIWSRLPTPVPEDPGRDFASGQSHIITRTACSVETTF